MKLVRQSFAIENRDAGRVTQEEPAPDLPEDAARSFTHRCPFSHECQHECQVLPGSRVALPFQTGRKVLENRSPGQLNAALLMSRGGGCAPHKPYVSRSYRQKVIVNMLLIMGMRRTPDETLKEKLLKSVKTLEEQTFLQSHSKREYETILEEKLNVILQESHNRSKAWQKQLQRGSPPGLSEESLTIDKEA